MESRTYRKFFDKEEAESLISLLKEHDIHGTIDEIHYKEDFTNGELEYKYFVVFPYTLFPTIDSIVYNDISLEEKDLDKDYYVSDYTIEELIEIVENPNTHSPYDFAFARKILELNAINYSNQDIQNFIVDYYTKNEIEEYPEDYKGPKTLKKEIAITTNFWWEQREIKDGKLVHKYSPNARKVGKIMAIIIVILFFALMAYLKWRRL